ncbi:MAG: GIY-YIG nuclease family protein [Bacilli bacterium]
MISNIIIAVLIIFIIGILLYFLVPQKKKFDDGFNLAIKDISKAAEELYNKELQEKTKKIEQDIAAIEEQKKELLDNYVKAIADFEETYKKKTEDKKEAIEQIMNDQIQAIKDENNRQRIELDKQKKEIFDNYGEVVKEYEEKKVRAKEKYDKVMEEYDNTIAKKKEEIQNLIEQFKRDEEAREEADFYRIAIPESFKNDIAKLKGVAAQLSNPMTLNKFIYKEYYEAAFNAMCGRVLGENAEKSGIYKITNIKNQMCYIGQTKAGFKNRWRTHVKRGLGCEEQTNNRLYTGLKEDGLENFTFQILEICEDKILTERERFYINFYDSKNWGYNSKI